ncbi:UNVERIFIED_CONTAM: hypothetical protein PYX00_011441 [Menopon gallinae]|uniref:Reverse transcriptase domain-containing protein n=1 Tax=Menopon gallinae TaxID=328185 RepID=A0AAW2H7L5_9NEOP
MFVAMVQWIHEVSSIALTYRDRSLREVPREVFVATYLKKLDLGENQLTALPGEIGNLSQLQELDLGENQLTTLPKEIGNLSQLQKLYLGNNQFTTLPGEIWSISLLQKLYLSNNQLTELPREIGSLPLLQALDLGNNQLTTLSGEIGNLSELQRLCLDVNELTTPPKEIESLSQLKWLDLSSNQFTALPREIAAPHLSIVLLNLTTNPLAEHGEGDTLGWQELSDMLEDKVLLDQDKIRGPDKVMEEDDVYQRLAASSPRWNITRLRTIVLESVPESKHSAEEILHIWRNKLARYAPVCTDGRDLESYIKTLWGTDKEAFKGWRMYDSSVPATRDLVEAVLVSLQDRPVDAEAYVPELCEALLYCPDRQMATLNMVYGALYAKRDARSFECFVENEIATLKRHILDIVVTPGSGTQNVHVQNYWRYKLREKLGLMGEYEPIMGTFGQDRFGGHVGNVLDVFYTKFTPKYMVGKLAEEINGRKERLMEAGAYLSGRLEDESYKRRVFEFASEEDADLLIPSWITHSGVEDILKGMGILERGVQSLRWRAASSVHAMEISAWAGKAMNRCTETARVSKRSSKLVEAKSDCSGTESANQSESTRQRWSDSWSRQDGLQFENTSLDKYAGRMRKGHREEFKPGQVVRIANRESQGATAKGIRCKGMHNKMPSANRRRVHDTPCLSHDTQGPEPICDIALLKQVRAAFLRHLEANRVTEMHARAVTRKIPQRKVDEEVLIGLNMVLAQVARKGPPETLDDVSLLLYTAQTAYQELTETVRPPSPWRASILAKIAGCEVERDCLMEHMACLENKKKGRMSREFRRILRREGARIWDVNDIRKAKANIEEKAAMYRRKIESHERRVSFRRTNDLFEFNRRMFYRRLHEEARPEGTQTDEEMVGFWAKVWERQESNECFEDLIERLNLLVEQHTEVSEAGRKLREIIERLPNWKTPGVDRVFNFFIKRCTSLHEHLVRIVENVLKQPEGLPGWFCTEVTYLIPKVQAPASPAEYKPITCMPNLYKVVTKLVTREFRDFVEANGILSENQLGTVRDCQGAKEQALIKKCVNQSHGNTLSTMWIDVRKAYDSVKHEHLLTCLERLGVPEWCTRFVASVVRGWRVRHVHNRKAIAEIGLERGILQGDSMSPLLFVLCMEPLSRGLNKTYETVPVEKGERWYSTNHLLFIDDIKLLARSKSTLEAMAGTTKAFLQRTGLEINPGNSATNVRVCGDVTRYLEEHEGYKYLGVLEDRQSII